MRSYHMPWCFLHPFLHPHYCPFCDQVRYMHTFNLIFSICPSGKKNKVRVYYLAWLRNKILHNDPEVEKKQGWTTVGEMEGCVHYKVGKCALSFIMHNKMSHVLQSIHGYNVHNTI